MEFSALQIANYLGGTVIGDEDVTVNTLSKIEDAQPGALSFLSNPKYTPYIYETKASIVIIDDNFIQEKEVSSTLVKVQDAYAAFAQLLELYNQVKHSKSGLEQPLFKSESATLGEDVYVGAFSYIGENVKIGNNTKIYPQCHISDNVVIGDNCLVFPGVKIMADSIVGNHVTLHSGVVVGSDGFGFAPNQENSYNKIPQIGNVIIEDHVDIGANSVIDRATMGSTIIRKGVKIDNLVQVAHNVEIGDNTVIASQTGIAGSAKIGKNCMIAGQVGIIGHITIGNGVKIAAQSGIGKSVADNEIIQGSPAFNFADYKKSYVYFRKLPQLAQDINQIEKKLRDNE